MCMECMQRVCPPNCPNAPEQAEEDGYALSIVGDYIDLLDGRKLQFAESEDI